MSRLGKTRLTAFDIEEVEGSRPVRSKPIRLSMKEQEGLREIIQQMKDADMIENSNSQYASPVLLVKNQMGAGGWLLTTGDSINRR